jgi:hypothetical protein
MLDNSWKLAHCTETFVENTEFQNSMKIEKAMKNPERNEISK